MKFNSHGTYIRPNKRRGNGHDARGVGFGNELPHAQAEHEQNQEARFKIVHARGRIVDAEMFRRQVQKSPDHEQRAAEQSAPFETGEAAFLDEAVKFREAGQREKNDDEKKNAAGNQRMAGEQGDNDHRPENHRGDQPAEKHCCF
jgi:hypothetical protein